MSIEEYIKNKRTIQNDIIQFIENEENMEGSFSNVTKDFNDLIKGNQNELKQIFLIITIVVLISFQKLND